MSRIGKKPIAFPDNVKINIVNNSVVVEGPKGKLEQIIFPETTVKLVDKSIQVERTGNSKKHNQMFGLLRTLISNMIEGVTVGFSKVLEMKGVGYRVQLKGKNLDLQAGFSHPINIIAPEGIEFKVEENVKIIISGSRKDQVGQIAAEIRSIRKPEPYKGKGIYYVKNGVLEKIIRKEGKRAAGSA